MRAYEVKFEKGKCYKTKIYGIDIVRLFKFESLGKSPGYINVFKGITIFEDSIVTGWVSSYVYDNDEVEEIDESLIDKVMKQFNMDRTAILATINGKRDE